MLSLHDFLASLFLFLNQLICICRCCHSHQLLIFILCLFALQHYGTHRVGFLFAPIVLAWLLCISTLGLYNIFKWNPHVYKVVSLYYMFKFLKKTRISGCMSLGGILLCITSKHRKIIHMVKSYLLH